MNKLFCVIFFMIMVLVEVKSQWIEKNNYWVLNETITDIKAVKVLPPQNIMMIVNSDSKISKYDFQTGKLIESKIPTEITLKSDYACISEDGATTILANYLTEKKFSDIQVTIVDNSTYEIIASGKFPNGIEYDGSQYKSISKLDITFLDYDSQQNIFILSSYINSAGAENSGQFKTENQSGNLFYAHINDKSLIVDKQFKDYSPLSLIRLKNFDNFKYAYLAYKYDSFGNARRASTGKYNIISLVINNLDTLIKFKSYYTYEMTDSYPEHSGSTVIVDKLVEINQIFESFEKSKLLLRGKNKLYKFNCENNRIIDSMKNDIFNYPLKFSNNMKYIHLIENNNYSVYSADYIRLLNKFTFDLKLKQNIFDIVETEGKVVLSDSAGTIILIKPNALQPVSPDGFYWSKDTVYTGEELEFTALTNIPGCKYEWYINNGIYYQSDTNKYVFSFDMPGKYGLKLKITNKDGEIFEYSKDSIITVLDKLKADFTIVKHSPNIIQFKDLSKGSIIYWQWDFGNGVKSNEQNPLYTYNLYGDFSPRLIVYDGISYDTLTAYELILIDVEPPVIQNTVKSSIIYKGKDVFWKNLYTSKGINHIRYSEIKDGFGFQGYEFRNEFINFYNYDYNLELKNIYCLSVCYRDYAAYLSNYPKGDVEVLNNDSLFHSKGCMPGKLAIIDINSGSSLTDKFNDFLFAKSKFLLVNSNQELVWISQFKDSIKIYKSDYYGNIHKEFRLSAFNYSKINCDTLNGNIDILLSDFNNKFRIVRINKNNHIECDKAIGLNPNIFINDIKSQSDNKILFGGYKKIDDKNSYAMILSFNTKTFQIDEQVIYNRKDIAKIERIGSNYLGMIGQSRGRQGYMIFDNNLKLLKDIRIDSLIGTINDIIVNKNSIYLITERIISIPVEAPISLDYYQTSSSKIMLPDDIIDFTDEDDTATNHSISIIFPNPATDYITINPGNKGLKPFTETDEKVEIYNSFGDLVMQDVQHLGDVGHLLKIDVSHLPVGVYFIKSGGRVEKFVKI